jgi:hypothetical protein
MKIKSITFLIYTALFSILLLGTNCMGDKVQRDMESRNIVKNGATWFIEHGIGFYYKERNEEILMKELNKKTEASFYTEVSLNELGSLATVIIEHRWRHAQIVCSSRVASHDSIYEYWVVSFFSATRADVKDRKIDFIVTKSPSITDRRIIIHQSSHFFESYLADSEIEISFPINNNKVIRWIETWRYPDAFQGTALEGVKFDFVNGKYIRSGK